MHNRSSLVVPDIGKQRDEGYVLLVGVDRRTHLALI